MAVLISGTFVTRIFSHQNLTPRYFQNQKLNWVTCNGDYECTSFKVPVNYEHIDNQVFTLQVIRHRAIDKNNSLGSLFVNPGGPGGSALNYAYNADNIVSKDIYDKYDIIGFDQRGVNQSDPIRCLDDKAEDKFLSSDGKANSAQEVQVLDQEAISFAQKCAAAAGERLGHVSTLEGARDMDLLRHLIHEPKLNYLGKSYGTYLGTLYAFLFPDKVGRMVLDGAVDPNVSIRDQNLVQATGFDSALNDYLKSQNKFKLSDISKIIKDTGVEPLRKSKGRGLTQALLITAIAESLYNNETGWPNLTRALEDVKNSGSPDLLLKIADTYNGRNSDGTFKDNQNDIGIMINCADWVEERSISEIKADARNFTKSAPIFGPFLAYAGLTCSHWKTKPELRSTKISVNTKSKIVVIGITKDPATPYVWATGLVQALKNSTLLTYDGEGHTGHNRGNSCIDRQVDGYFLTGKLPPKGLICRASGN
jgi:pimeloyl-ACP methyl ester carboxylesterase